MVDSLVWMRKWTRSWDEHDTVNPYKPLPDYRYFDVLHHLFLTESRLFVEKSRTVMATWWGAGECLHYVMTHQPASCIFWCPDEDRAIKCMKYCKVFYAQQRDDFKALYTLPRKKKAIDDQAVYRFELASGGWLEALPGKNPDKIRSEHPTIVFMDECAFNENGAEAYANAISTRPQKLIAISSAYPGWFYDMIEPAETIPLPVCA
jgi:phage FluMu gp28-like protein